MVGHVFLFNSGIVKLKELVDVGELGTLRYLSASRTNLGPIRSDVNVAYDLCSHDISIFNWLLGSEPEVAKAGQMVRMLLGEDDHGPWTEEDPDREMRIAVAVPIAQLLDEYEARCARYRDLVASLDLDTPSKRPVGGRPVTLRWILFHLIEETARHNGHLDILRELADGVTGT
jgi:hypothetical protein